MSSARLPSPQPKIGLKRNQIVAIIMAILAICLVVDFSRKAVDSYRVKARAEELKEMIETTRAENQRLRNLKEFAQTNAFIEQEARRDFKMGRPEEVRVIFLTSVSRQGEGSGPRSRAIPPSATSQTEEPCWQPWWRLFFDREPPSGSLP